ncbi:MAG: AMP-dependent synthetase, partial [Steroidobacteraceae bacterium]
MSTNDATLSEWLAEGAGEPALELTLAGALAQAAAQWPEREAVVYRHQPGLAEVAWTYREL